jgi:hypothetical protein
MGFPPHTCIGIVFTLDLFLLHYHFLIESFDNKLVDEKNGLVELEIRGLFCLVYLAQDNPHVGGMDGCQNPFDLCFI